jgi:hypothetical protein
MAVMATMALWALPSLEAMSRFNPPVPCFPFLPVEKPQLHRIGRRWHSCVVTSLEASPWDGREVSDSGHLIVAWSMVTACYRGQLQPSRWLCGHISCRVSFFGAFMLQLLIGEQYGVE